MSRAKTAMEELRKKYGNSSVKDDDKQERDNQVQATEPAPGVEKKANAKTAMESLRAKYNSDPRAWTPTATKSVQDKMEGTRKLYEPQRATAYFDDGYDFGDVTNMALTALTTRRSFDEKGWRESLRNHGNEYYDAAVRAKGELDKLSTRIADIDSMTETLKRLQDSYKVAPSEETAKQYEQEYQKYSQAVQEYEAVYKPLADTIDEYNAFIDLYGEDIGTPRDASFFDATIGSLKRGYVQSRLGEEWYGKMQGHENEADKYEQIMSGEDYQFEAGGLYAPVSGAAEQVGQWVRQWTNPRSLAMGGTAATAAAIAGQLGPQVLAPEELITVPGALASGMAVGSAMQNLEIEAGLAYKEMLELGISEDTARTVATIVGGGNAALEALQIDELVKGAKVVAGKPAREGVFNIILDVLKKRAPNVANQVLQEVAQEGTTMLGTTFGSYMDKGEGAYSWGEAGSRLLDTALSSTLSFGFLDAPGTVMNVSSQVSQNSKLGKIGNEYQVDVGALVEEGLTLPPGSEAHKLAREFKERLDAGETVTDAEVGRLVVANERAIKTEEYLNEPLEEADSDPILEAAREAVGIETASGDAVQDVQEVSRENDTQPIQGENAVEVAQNARRTRPMTIGERTGYGEHGTKTFTEIVEEMNADPMKVRQSFQPAYEAGLANAPRDRINLLDVVQAQAYNAGLRDKLVLDAKDSKGGKVTVRKDAGFVYDTLPADVTPMQAKAVDMLAKATGVRVQIAKGLKGNAEIRDDGTVLIDEDFEREVSGKKRSIVFYAAHEIGMHRLMHLAPKEGRAFINALVAEKNKGLPYGAATDTELKQDLYAQQNVSLSIDKAMEEVSADAVLGLYENEEAFFAAIDRIMNGTDEQAKKGARTFKQWLDDTVRKLKQIVAKLTGKERAQVQETLNEVTSLRDLYERAMTAAVDRAKNGKVANQSGRAENSRGTIDYSAKEVGAYAQEGKPESRREFLERSNRSSRKGGEVRGIAYSYVPVGAWDTSRTAEETAQELKALGIPSFFHDGLEYNVDGKTFVVNDYASTIGDEIVGVLRNAFGDGKELAGHEAYHIWCTSTTRDAYTAVLRKNIDMLTPYALQQAGLVDRGYFKGAKINQTLFVEEYFARISGQIHSGKHDADLATMFKDYESVKAAWNRLVEQNAGEQYSLKSPAVEVGNEGASFEENGVQYSIKSLRHDITEGRMFNDLVQAKVFTQKEADLLKTNLDKLISYMLPNANILDMNESYTKDNRPYKAYKPNSDPLYGISLDFSTLCRKRLMTQYVIEQLQLRENRPMSAEEQMAIRSMLLEYRKQEKALQVTCAMCYVEAARLKAPKQMDRFFHDTESIMRKYFAKKDSGFNAKVVEAQKKFKRDHGYDENAPKKDMKAKDVAALNKMSARMRTGYTPSAEQQAIINTAVKLPRSSFLTAANLTALAIDHPEIYNAYTDHIRASTRSKSLEGDIPYYYGDSRESVSDTFIDNVNAENGMRFDSWSDFQMKHMLDMITAVVDLSVRKSKMHGYTKFPEMVRIFGKTGMMFNLSGVADGNGFDANGNLLFSDTESIDFNEAIKLRKAFPETAGLQCIGVSDDHIRALLRSDYIDYVIPYHTSGMNAALRRMAGIYEWQDYTKTQHARKDPNAKKPANAENWQVEPVWSEFFVNKGKDGYEVMQNTAKRYVEMCRERGLIPKFDQFLDEDGYWKLLVDRKMVNQETGTLIEQKAVRPDFDFELIQQEIDREVSQYDPGLEQRALKYVVDNFDAVNQRIRDLKKRHPKKAMLNMGNEVFQAYAEGSKRNEGVQYSLKPGTTAEQAELSDANVQYSLRKKSPPKKVGIAYKVFYTKNGQLYPPMVANPGGAGTPVGVWLDADVAAPAAPSKTGRPQVQAGGKGTNAGKMSLAFRPGWHLGDLPMATQFARKNPETGAKDLFPADFVWAECEYAMDHDYQDEAMSYGYTENGKFRHAYAGLPRLPEDGYYRYRTNPNPDTVPWVITGAMRVKRILTDAETDKILRDAGVEPMKRQGGPIDLESLGLKDGLQYSLKGEGDMRKEIERIRKEGEKAGKTAEEIYSEIKNAVSPQYQELIKTFGAIKPGERPAREIEVPKKTEEDRPVSQTIRTILEAEATPDAAVPTIQELITQGDFSYDVITDKAAMEAAKKSIRTKGYETSLAEWLNEIKAGKVSKANTALGWELYNQAANAGDLKTAMTILNGMVGHQRNAAQAVQATRILKKLSPDAQLYGMARSVDSLKEDLIAKYGKKAPDIEINEELARKFLEAKTEEDRAAAEAEIYRDIGRQMPSTFMDKWNAWRYLAMLGNPRTHVRNIIGNAGFALPAATKNLLATGIESAVSFVSRGKIGRTKAMPSRELLKAAWADYANVADELMAGGKYNDAAIKNQHIEEGRVIFKNKILEGARKGNSAALEAEDKWFAQPHYALALAQYCKANGVTADQLRRGKALGNARAYAIKEAQKATYRDINAFSETISSLGRYQGDNMVKKGVSTVVEGILPFRKTPANILVRGLEYSPIGLAKGIKQALWDVQRGNKTAAEAIDSISAGLTGTGLLVLGLWFAAEGLIRGAGGDDEEEKKFEELQGHQAYSLELPDGTSVTLDWLAPEVLPMFIGVNLYEMARDNKGKSNLSDILTAVSNVTEPLLEMSCLQSLNDLFDSVGYATSGGLSALPTALASAATSYLTQAFPTILGQAERSGQDVRMTTYTEKNGFLTSDMQYTLGKISAKVPGWDFQQIPYVDAWGRTESTGNPVGNAANNFLNPAYTSQIETSAMERELERLYDATGESYVLPSRADKYFTVNKERKDLTAEEYVKYATEKGQLSYKVVTALTKSAEYKSMTDFERVEAVGYAYAYANAIAKTKVSKYAPEGWIAKAIATNKNTGLSPERYIPLYMKQKDIESLRDADGDPISNSSGLQVMELVYKTSGLTSEQRHALFADFGVGKTIIHYNAALVDQKLKKMRK